MPTWREHVLVLITGAIPACSPLVAATGDDTGLEASTATSTAAADDDAPGDATTEATTGEPTPSCPVAMLASQVPTAIGGSIDGAIDRFAGSCGGVTGDAAVTFTAPQDGRYRFDTSGSAFDTVLYALDGVCDGIELACADDGTTTAGVLTLPMVGGQTITLVVDGYAPPVSGAWELAVDLDAGGSCPDGDLGDVVPQTVVASSDGAIDVDAGSCGGPGRERSYLFTAPTTGRYVFDAAGSSGLPAVYVRAGGCGGSELACDVGREPQTGTSGVVVELAAGAQVAVVVDGFAGGQQVMLGVDALRGTCPAAELDGSATVELDDLSDAYGNSGGRSCGGWFAPDASYRWSPPADGRYIVSVDADFPAVLAAYAGACDGPELGCSSVLDRDGARLVLDLQAGQPITLVVDALGKDHGAFTLTVAPDACPEIELGVVSSAETLAGTLVGATATTSAGCTDASGPDVAYGFVAGVGGLWTIDTVGSSFDSVLTVRDESCDGTPLACDDDGGGNSAARVHLQLAAGQRVVATVDGFAGAVGSYDLRLIPPD